MKSEQAAFRTGSIAGPVQRDTKPVMAEPVKKLDAEAARAWEKMNVGKGLGQLHSRLHPAQSKWLTELQ
jgi:hypothetical protein